MTVPRPFAIEPANESEPIALLFRYNNGFYLSHALQVLDPSSHQWISAKQAIYMGLYDPVKEIYFNLKTGELLSTKEAYARKLVKLGPKVTSI